MPATDQEVPIRPDRNIPHRPNNARPRVDDAALHVDHCKRCWFTGRRRGAQPQKADCVGGVGDWRGTSVVRAISVGGLLVGAIVAFLP